jgi:5-formyltetrahydrofolate cyclo-ligase
MNKIAIRQLMREKRRALSRDAVVNGSAQVAKRVMQLPQYIEAEHIAFYQAHENEIECGLLMQQSLQLEKMIYLPVFSGKNQLKFYGINSATPLVNSRWGIAEPVIYQQSPVSAEKIELFFIPLVAFDDHGYRLGRGAGCYDRYLSFVKNQPRDRRPTLVGLAYDFQKIDRIVPQSWDIQLDYVVTDQGVIEGVGV